MAKESVKTGDIAKARQSLLDWYQREGRDLPWRYREGEVADPYRVWLSEIMLQQTTVTAVIPYFQKFIERWPTVQALAAADLEEIMTAWAGLGYYRRARNLHACAVYICEHFKGIFPSDLKELKKLPGVGDYTGAAVRAIAFNKAATVVDGNVERVIARFYALDTPMPALKKDVKIYAEPYFERGCDHPSSLAQAFMDLGAGVCTVQNPKCSLCPLNHWCLGFAANIANSLPVKAPKKKKPQKVGYVYWVLERGHVLVEQRGEEGMLAQMTGLPTSDWVESSSDLKHLPDMDLMGDALPSIYHSFTHFDLELIPFRASFKGASPAYYEVLLRDIEEMGFPTLFKKALKVFLTS